MNIRISVYFSLPLLLFATQLRGMEIEKKKANITGSISQKQQPLVKPEASLEGKLVELFLTNTKSYKTYVSRLYGDMNRYLARILLKDHPMVKAIKMKLMKKCLLHTLYHEVEMVRGRGNFLLMLSNHDEERALSMHKAIVSAHYNKSGTKIVTTHGNCWVHIWDATSGAHMHSLQDESGPHMYATAMFNPAGDRILKISSGMGVKIWDVETGVCLHTIGSYTFGAFFANFSESGDQVILANHLKKFYKAANVVTGNQEYLLEHADDPLRVGEEIMTVNRNGFSKVWKVPSQEFVSVLNQCRIDYIPNHSTQGDRVLTLSEDGTAKNWDTQSGECLHTLHGHVHKVKAAQFNLAADNIITVSEDGSAKIWHVASGTILHTLLRDQTKICSAKFNTAGTKIVAGSEEGRLQLWDVASGNCIHELLAHESVFFAQFNHSNDRVVTASRDGTAKVWDFTGLDNVGVWLNKDCTLEHALLLLCIYEMCIINTIKKKLNSSESYLFDFGRCPHLIEHFNTMPNEIRACLAPFVMNSQVSAS